MKPVYAHVLPRDTKNAEKSVFFQVLAGQDLTGTVIFFDARNCEHVDSKFFDYVVKELIIKGNAEHLVFYGEPAGVFLTLSSAASRRGVRKKISFPR